MPERALDPLSSTSKHHHPHRDHLTVSLDATATKRAAVDGTKEIMAIRDKCVWYSAFIRSPLKSWRWHETATGHLHRDLNMLDVASIDWKFSAIFNLVKW
jgi:hypothetical protein